MIMLSCNNVSKSFGVETILEDISFSVNEGDKIGIVGVMVREKLPYLR